MKLKYVYSVFILSLFLVISNAFKPAEIHAPCDAPPLGAAHSGAPGEVNCSGCHSGTPNTGPGTLTFDLGTINNLYTPGQTYTIDIKLVETGVDKFGFQTIVLKDSNNAFTGSYNLTDPTNTRIINGTGGKTYVGTTKCGSDANPADSIAWSFEWTAPVMDEGSVTFYLSTLATNHSHTSSGDNTYTQVVQLFPDTISGINELFKLSNQIVTGPNPASDNIWIKYLINNNASKMSVQLIDLTGKQLTVFSENTVNKGRHQEYIDLRLYNLADGIYFLKIKIDERAIIKILSIQN